MVSCTQLNDNSQESQLVTPSQQPYLEDGSATQMISGTQPKELVSDCNQLLRECKGIITETNWNPEGRGHIDEDGLIPSVGRISDRQNKNKDLINMMPATTPVLHSETVCERSQNSVSLLPSAASQTNNFLQKQQEPRKDVPCESAEHRVALKTSAYNDGHSVGDHEVTGVRSMSYISLSKSSLDRIPRNVISKPPHQSLNMQPDLHDKAALESRTVHVDNVSISYSQSPENDQVSVALKGEELELSDLVKRNILQPGPNVLSLTSKVRISNNILDYENCHTMHKQPEYL